MTAPHHLAQPMFLPPSCPLPILTLPTMCRYTRGAARGVLASPERGDTDRNLLERDLGDSASDIESVVSGTSTFSTQSERPRGSVKHRCFKLSYLFHCVEYNTSSFIENCLCLSLFRYHPCYICRTLFHESRHYMKCPLPIWISIQKYGSLGRT